MPEAVQLVRVVGGAHEVLDGVGATALNQPFDCAPDLAQRLLGDGTRRFEAAGVPAADGGDA